MPSIDLEGVSYAHTDSVPLIQGLTMRLYPGWTGIVGANGAGKTTLLDLLRGELDPDLGTVIHTPADLSVHLCPQKVEHLESAVRALGEDTSGAAQRVCGRLGLLSEQLERWETLSPGERKRWQIGAALSLDPDVLLLDEPTNHLDVRARDDLLAALDAYRGIGVVVSHDRSVLMRLTHHTVRIHRGHARLYRGDYEQAKSTWEATEREEMSAYVKLSRERKKQRKRLGDKRRARDKAERGKRTSRNMKSQHDSDARGRFKQKRRRSAEVSLGRDIQLTHRRIDRIDSAMEDFTFDKALGGRIFVDYTTAPVPHLLVLQTDRLQRAGRTLARDLSLEIRRESRVHVAGPNGSGKTTLLAGLLAEARIPASRVLYLPQELTQAEGRALLEDARQMASDERGRLMNIIAALGVDPGSLLRSADPSPGEARKLALAIGLAREAWLLVLDEPTNHLDLPSIVQLEEALAAYPGALVLVTHDDALAARVSTEEWRFEDGRIISSRKVSVER